MRGLLAKPQVGDPEIVGIDVGLPLHLFQFGENRSRPLRVARPTVRIAKPSDARWDAVHCNALLDRADALFVPAREELSLAHDEEHPRGIGMQCKKVSTDANALVVALGLVEGNMETAPAASETGSSSRARLASRIASSNRPIMHRA